MSLNKTQPLISFSNLVKEINEEIRTHWDANKSPSVLSRIGTKLSPNAKSELKLSGGKLKSFILSHTPEQLRYIFIDTVGDCAAPLPEAGVFSDIELVELYNEARLKSRGDNFLHIRFQDEVWQGFIRDIRNGKRWISFSTTPVKLIENPESPGEGYIEIDDSDLAFHSDGTRLTYKEAQEKILEWARRHNVSDLILSNEPRRKTSNQASPKQIAKGEDRLAQALSCLTEEDLRRISVPGDIVLKIIREALSINDN